MKIADYVSKYLKESYDEPKGIENEEDAKKAIEDLKDFFEMGEDEENEFGDDLDKMLMAMDSGEEDEDVYNGMTDDELDELDSLFDEGDDSSMEEGDCSGCETTEEKKYCPDCGKKKEGVKEEGVKEEGKDWEDMTPEEQRRQERHSVKQGDVEEGRRGHDSWGNNTSDYSPREFRNKEWDEDDYNDYDREIKFDKYGNKIGGDPLAGLKRKPRGSRRGLYSSKNYKMTEMEKKLEEYREGKKNKKGHKPKGVVDAGDSSDGE